MSELNNSELLLLSNLIYLKLNVFNDNTAGKLVKSMLYRNNLKKAIMINGECGEVVKKKEWILVLKQIQENDKLNNLKIDNVEVDNNGVKTACFIDKHDNAYVVFRGTKTIEEWGDNGEGAYMSDTPEQISALKYINNLKYTNITVTGHSKGGNKAKYVTLLSNKINRCVSFDGQGFSNEFINRYSKEINKNKDKIISINAKYDYVNCLLNSINEKKKYIETSFQKNPLYYHKANIMLDGNGTLRKETTPCSFVKIIYKFSTSLISKLPEPHKSFAINSLTDIIELILCDKDLESSILQIAKGILMLLGYTKHYNLKAEINLAYNLLQSLSIPLVFWNDFIRSEENDSKLILNETLLKFKIYQENIILKLKNLGIEGKRIAIIIDNATNNLIEDFQNAN
ncbi:Mbeg1-like protein [uncultured Clostridium sp.]|uniref:Mbeg1-like protein n=1 Tax=uncultured Clostridium sp. TaxID=59620 RepID=UPI0028E81EC9|nr:Mbeg1-like protein [uncultured Clostridium sp.]